MDNAKHTPGPWKLETVPTSIGTCHRIGPFPSNSGIEGRENYACVYADNIYAHDIGHSKTGDELLANARLIAAAPDLLGALRTLRAHVSAAHEHARSEQDARVYAGYLSIADAAIAKATQP